MSINKKIILISTLLLVTMMAITTVTATNMDNTTDKTTHMTDTNNMEEIQTNRDTLINKKEYNPVKEASTKTITNTTYKNYFTNTTTYIPESTSQISRGDTINLEGTFTNMDFVIDKENITFTSINKNAKLFNCTVYIQNSATGSTLSNMDIYNTNKENAIGIYVNNTQNIIIENNHVIIDDCSYSFAFAGSLNKSIIRSNYFETLSTTTPRTHTSCVLGRSYYNLITNNTVKSDEADGIYFSSYPSGRFTMAGSCSNNNITHNNVSGGDGIWVNLIQTDGTNNKIEYNNVTGGYEGIVVLGGNALITNNNVNGPKQYGIDIQSDATISNNNITVRNVTDAIRVYKNAQLNNNKINSENGFGVYLESGDECANFNITNNNITSTNSTGIYTKGTANNIIIEDNTISTRQAGINFGQQSATKRANNILINNNNITTQTDHAINFTNAGSRIAANINITVTDTNILTSLSGTGLHINYIPPANNQTITQVRTQIQLEEIVTSYLTQTNITATILTRDMSTINNGNITFTNNRGEQIGTAQITNNKSTITISFTDYNITHITAVYDETENYTASQNTTSITIKTDNLFDIIQMLLDENNNLREQLENNQSAITQLTTENNQLQEQVQQLQNQTQEIQQENIQQKQQILELNQTVLEQQNTINNQNSTIMEQEQEIELLNQKLDETNYADIEQLQNTIQNLTNQNTQLNNQINIQEETINNLSTNLTRVKNNMEQLNQTIHEQETQIGTLNSKVNMLTAQNNELRNNNTRYNEQINSQENIINNLNNQLGQLNKTIQTQTNTIKQYNQTIHEQETQIATLNSKVNMLTAQNNELRNNNTRYNEQINSQEKIINNLNNQLGQLNKTIKQQKQEIEENKEIINKQNDTINKLNNDKDKLNQTIKELTTKTNTKLSLANISQTKYSTYIKVTGNLTDNKGNPLKNQVINININTNKDKVITDNKGTYTYKVKANTIGTNRVIIQYESTDKYNTNSQSTTFNVQKQGLNIKINNIQQTKYGNNVTINGTFKDDNGKGLMNTILRININGKTVKTKTTINGTFTYTTQTDKTGTNNITITYPGNKNYNQVTQKATFQVIKQEAKIIVNPITPVRYTDNTTISGMLMDANGKKIQNTKLTIKTDKKTYTTNTDQQGNYRISIKTMTTGTNNLSITYDGNNNYNKKTIKTTYKVNKQEIKHHIGKITHTSTKITISGTLTDNNENPIKNSNIKITTNNNTKTLKTDNRGAYTYILNTKQKELKLTLVYPGNSEYNKYIKTTMLTIT